jgi:ubiquinone biosynthesis protein Coq4
MSHTMKSAYLQPSQGIDWRKVWQAYCVFMPNPAQGILHILAAAEYSRWQKWVLRRLRRQAAPILDWEVVIDLDRLVQLPPDTLGGAYARHMIQQGFTADAFIDRDLNKLPFTHRLAIAHDVQHIITGFDSSEIGEFGLAAFMLVQYWDMLNVFVLSWVPWFMLGNMLSIPKLFIALYRGFTLGWRSRALVAYPFEMNWDKSILEVRRELRITSPVCKLT